MQPAWNKRDTGKGLLGHRGTRMRMRSIHCVSLALAVAVQCETWHGVMPASAEGFAL